MDILGKYELHEVIGEGGFATVYRATHRLLETEAAVKKLNPKRLIDPRWRSLLEQEARIAASLSHPHIVKIFDLIREKDTFAIAMEYLPEGNLRQWVEENQPNISTILELLFQIAEALDYLHSQESPYNRPLLHGDVKPENVLMDKNPQTGAPQAKLSDFGLTSDFSLNAEKEKTTVLGSAFYISPEVAEGMPFDMLDGRADQYSLGVMAYELLTKKRPFEGNDPVAVMSKRLDDAPLPPSEISEIPFEFDEPLLKALAREPENRFDTCGDFIRTLQEAWQATSLRQAREALTEAQNYAEKQDFEKARAYLEKAKFYAPRDPRVKDMEEQIAQHIEWTVGYTKAVKNWKSAQKKAQAVLDLSPDFPDTEGVFEILGLRAPQKQPIDWADTMKQIAIGLGISLPFAALFFYWAIRWILTHPK